MVRRGFQPASRSIASARPVSRTAAVPEDGSTAPATHASRWLPRITTYTIEHNAWT